MLVTGAEGFQELLRGYWRGAAPALFASDEADGFARYLEDRPPPVPHLSEVLAFERSTMATLLDSRPRTVRFTCDPLPLLRALAAGRLPETMSEGEFEVLVTPDPGTAAEGLRPLVANH
jgi:hypothetical protein